jgi:hypothetical protein
MESDANMPCYFFSGGKFIRVALGQVGAGAVDPGYPHPISDWGWGEVGADGHVDVAGVALVEDQVEHP